MMLMKANSFVYRFLIRAIILFFLLLEVVHFEFKGINFIMPNILVMSIFFWGVYENENIFSKEYLVLICLFSEILKGELVGPSTIIYVVFFYCSSTIYKHANIFALMKQLRQYIFICSIRIKLSCSVFPKRKAQLKKMKLLERMK